jgi:hypothetical protein
MSADFINSRTGTGAGIGAILGFMFFGGPIGGALGSLVGGAIAHTTKSQPKGVMTAARRLVFVRAMESVKSPTALRELSTAFANEGLIDEATLLAKRAATRELPPAAQNERRAIFRKAMASDNPDGVREVAAKFAAAGSIDAARLLRDHAAAVEAAHAAGRTTRAVTPQQLDAFAEKLAKAIAHFGADSRQARSAAKNLISAQGKVVSDAAVKDLIAIATGVLDEDAKAMADAEAAATAEQERAQESKAPVENVASATDADPTMATRVEIEEQPPEPMNARSAS